MSVDLFVRECVCVCVRVVVCVCVSDEDGDTLPVDGYELQSAPVRFDREDCGGSVTDASPAPFLPLHLLTS